MNCKNCNAVMRVDHERKVYVCPYCENIEPFEGVSKEELQGMLHDAIHDVRQESFQEAKRTLQDDATHKDKRSTKQKIKDAVILIFQIIFCIFLAIFSLGIFTDYEWVGVISIAQLVLMISAIILKHRYLDTGSKKVLKIKNVCLILVVALVVAWIVMLLREERGLGGSSREASWPTQGLGSEIEAPEGTIKYAFSSKSEFSATVKDEDGSGFSAFVAACKEAGYVIDVELDDGFYHAYNENDDELTVNLWSDSFNVKLDRGIVMGEFQWPTGELAQGVPKPSAEKSGLIKLSSNSFQIVVGDVTQQQFVQYVLDCQEAGFSGTYRESSNSYYGTKDKLSVRVDFKRGRIMVIDVYEGR